MRLLLTWPLFLAFSICVYALRDADLVSEILPLQQSANNEWNRHGLFYELAKEPLTFRFHLRASTKPCNEKSILCVCYETNYALKDSYSGCIKGYAPLCSTMDYSDFSVYTGHGSAANGASEAGYVVSYRSGQKAKIPPMKVTMITAVDNNFVPAVRMYTVDAGVAYNSNVTGAFRVQTCGIVYVENLYAASFGSQALAEGAAGHQECVSNCHCP